jgi:hypothetical protein
MDVERLRDNVRRVRERIAAACARAGRRSDDITLVAITKYVAPPAIEALAACGITDCGENRVLEGVERVAQVQHPFRWHFVGHVQTNKARRLVDRFAIIHSIDRWDLAAQLDRHKKSLTGFVQVNVSGEGTKGGVAPGETAALVGRIRRECGAITLAGLMTMAPHGDDAEASRPHFRRLRELAVSCGLDGLSMGMSDDFEVAIEEGATHVRIGSALWEGVTTLTI